LLQGDGGPGDRFLAVSQAMCDVRAVASRVAPKDVPVLLIGESGSGKGILARSLHDDSCNADGPFVKVNCAALPRDLLESELFGHEKGAFTGAVTRRPGRFEQAAGGTIFLDEIGELSPDLQAKLLHVLDDHTFHRVGGSEELSLEARIVAATNKPLERAVSLGDFRDDLYFRLAVVWIEVPPLRRRPEDVVMLARHFFEVYSKKYEIGSEEISEELMEAMLHYDWPGNVRELKNFVQRCVLFSDLDTGLTELRRGRLMHRAEEEEQHVEPASASLLDIGAAAAEQAEKRAAFLALEETNWNRKAAAKRLNISYKTLLNKLNKWDQSDDSETDHSSEGSGDRPRWLL